MSGVGFAVIDLETTGFSPKRGDRILEIGLIQITPDGEIENRFTTLVNPQRDVGPTSIHGIRASDVIDAPTFGEIAPAILNMITNRVIVAHNVSFDLRFLEFELQHAGQIVDLAAVPNLCTMNLAPRFLNVSKRSLDACCQAAGIEFQVQHAALADAEASAQLLLKFFEHEAFQPQVIAALARTDAIGTSSTFQLEVPQKHRGHAEGKNVEGSFVAKTIQSLSDSARTDEERELLILFDQILSDGLIEAEEEAVVEEFIANSSLSVEQIRNLQNQYFLEFANAAWADGSLNRAEILGVRYVGKMMQQSDLAIEAAINVLTDGTSENAPHFERVELRIEAGDHVVLTGEMEMPRNHYVELLENKGILIASGVTKKVVAVIAQDVNTLSGKARKARTMGIPIVCIEDVLPALLEE